MYIQLFHILMDYGHMLEGVKSDSHIFNVSITSRYTYRPHIAG